jgi:hypothetical protein
MNKVQKGVNFIKCNAFNNIVKNLNKNDAHLNELGNIKDIICNALNEIENIKRKYNES